MRIVLLATWVLLMAWPVDGQATSPDACGTLPDKEEELQDLARYFVSDEYADVRGAAIARVAPTEPRYVVSDARVCRAVRAQAVARLQANANRWVGTGEGDHEFAVFRYGSYYAVLLVASDTSGEIATGWAPLMVFRASDLEFLKAIAT